MPPDGIAHVNLRVSDPDRALDFYAGLLGLRVNGRLGDELAFLGAREDECDTATTASRSAPT